MNNNPILNKKKQPSEFRTLSYNNVNRFPITVFVYNCQLKIHGYHITAVYCATLVRLFLFVGAFFDQITVQTNNALS